MVERFQMKTEHDWVCARPDPKGDWVRLSDYEALRSELEQARRERDGFRDIAARKSDQVAALIKAEAAQRLAGARVVTEAMKAAADQLEKIAFNIPAPNPHTPQLVTLAIGMRDFVLKAAMEAGR